MLVQAGGRLLVGVGSDHTDRKVETYNITVSKQMCDTTGFSGGLDEFGLCFGDIFTPIPEMIEIQAALHRAGVATYVFSNTNDLAIRHIRREFPFFQNFTGYIFSYEHGVMKPEPGIYEALERACGRRGRQIVYLDDRPENALMLPLRRDRLQGLECNSHDAGRHTGSP